MRIVFAGTPPFAASALAALMAAAPAHGWSVVGVLSQPDRPSGRGLKLTASAVKALALAHGVPVATPESLSLKRGGAAAASAHAGIAAWAPDVLVVAAYGLILPQAVLDIPRGLRAAAGATVTAINIHASLLPRWRGAAPAARAIEAGDTGTGVTLMQMDAGLDTGPMLLTATLPIAPTDTTATLTAALAHLGARLLVQGLAEIASIAPQPQPATGVTYAHKIDKAEAWLDLRRPAVELERQVRAFDPFPGAVLMHHGAALKIGVVRVAAAPNDVTPGTVLAADAGGVLVATGDGALVVGELQKPGGRRLPAAQFLAGYALAPGQRCELRA